MQSFADAGQDNLLDHPEHPSSARRCSGSEPAPWKWRWDVMEELGNMTVLKLQADELHSKKSSCMEVENSCFPCIPGDEDPSFLKMFESPATGSLTLASSSLILRYQPARTV
ncbi:hypothetical protein llap_7699 [Limosa lapponica baueri]|uniref:Uncharacterized protein n=1 Tax=Limosa lapponica baueri TaxID=1758121 RepID=A0A2I0U7Q7_LIMLA|nr:hypothetical protein llap_7699 [Limosa lapponica baueri]